jgi:hypothetical protein
MDLPSKHVLEILSNSRVGELHHANSVATACQFLRSKSLMSRGMVERCGFSQTPQASDEIDRRYGIWFDVFLDSVDIHSRAGRSNVYGPVLFVLDSKLIERKYTGRIWVTKLNPTKWAKKSASQRWFQSKADLEEGFVRGNFDQMLVFRHCGGELPFGSYLKRIILDDPKCEVQNGVDCFSMAYGALKLAMADGGLDVPIERRVCPQGCLCFEEYVQAEEMVSMMFDPMVD